jgi:hypothetical protein
MTRDLPLEAPPELWPDSATETLAGASLAFAWKSARLPGMAWLKWFAPGPKQAQLGMLDEETGDLWVATDLRDDELVRTVFHEVEHARQHAQGEPFSEGAAIVAAERGLARWHQRTADLHAAAAKSGVARGPVGRLPFPGDSEDADAPMDPLAHLRLPARHTPTRIAYPWDRGSE